jgi:hypothetical protein
LFGCVLCSVFFPAGGNSGDNDGDVEMGNMTSSHPLTGGSAANVNGNSTGITSSPGGGFALRKKLVRNWSPMLYLLGLLFCCTDRLLLVGMHRADSVLLYIWNLPVPVH